MSKNYSALDEAFRRTKVEDCHELYYLGYNTLEALLFDDRNQDDRDAVEVHKQILSISYYGEKVIMNAILRGIFFIKKYGRKEYLDCENSSRQSVDLLQAYAADHGKRMNYAIFLKDQVFNKVFMLGSSDFRQVVMCFERHIGRLFWNLTKSMGSSEFATELCDYAKILALEYWNEAKSNLC